MDWKKNIQVVAYHTFMPIIWQPRGAVIGTTSINQERDGKWYRGDCQLRDDLLFDALQWCLTHDIQMLKVAEEGGSNRAGDGRLVVETDHGLAVFMVGDSGRTVVECRRWAA